jgi:uncharacterized protein (TIGR00255 family)
MTGFGSASLEEEGLRAVVEVRSVNNRYLKIVVKAPAALNGRVPEIEGLVRARVRRGTVTVHVHVSFRERPPAYVVNPAAVRAYRTELESLAEQEGIPGEVTLADLAALPGVLEPVDVEPDIPEDDWGRIRKTAEKAIAALLEMRDVEGRALAEEIVSRQALIESDIAAVHARAPEVVDEYRARLSERLRSVLEEHGAELPAEDILKEVAIFADRADIAEEIARLGSHLSQMREAVTETGECGRKLEFILQEMLREANTIGAKSNDFAIAEKIVGIKTEIEKLKEQVQNLE